MPTRMNRVRGRVVLPMLSESHISSGLPRIGELRVTEIPVSQLSPLVHAAHGVCIQFR